jgi:archaellum component FlaG (FlaF/FlaG flagellin family)
MKRLLIVFLLVFVAQAPSNAAEKARWSGTKSATSGSWSVIAIGANQSPANAPYTITWVVNTGTAYNFFTLRNTGSYSVIGFSVDVTQVQVGGSGKPNNTTFELCQNGVWNVSTNTCSGTRVTVGTTVDLYSSLLFNGLNLGIGTELSMRASTPPNIKNIYTTTLSVNVPRTQIRSGVVTNT